MPGFLSINCPTGARPHSVANSGMTLSDWHGFNSSLRYRHISGYILDGSDSTVPRATGLDVLDLGVSKRIRRGIDFNFAIDNLNNKHFWGNPELPGIPRGTTRSSEASSSWHSWQPHRPDGRVHFSDRREVAEKRESRKIRRRRRARRSWFFSPRS
jgi:hypothetical protein